MSEHKDGFLAQGHMTERRNDAWGTMAQEFKLQSEGRVRIDCKGYEKRKDDGGSYTDVGE